MNDLAQFSALAALIVGGFGLFAFMFQRLEDRIDRLEDSVAAEFRQQRKEVADYVTAIATAISASRK